MRTGHPRILVLATQPGALEFLAPVIGLREPMGGQVDWTLLTNPAWLEGRPLGHGAQVQILPLPSGTAALDQCFRSPSPDRVIASATAHAMEAHLLALAKSLGIRTVQVIDAPYDYASRIARDVSGNAVADAIALPIQAATAEAMRGGLPASLLHATGHPGWERILPDQASQPEAAVFMSQPLRQDGMTDLGYDEGDAWACVLEARQQRPDLLPVLYWAGHPREATPPGIAESCDGVMTSGKDALQRCGTILGMFSAILIEAHLKGRHVFSVQPNASRQLDMCALSRYGHASCVQTPNALIAELDMRDGFGQDAALRNAMTGSTGRLLHLLFESAA